jgi:DNA-binding MarR family transcriptional regulator
LDLKSEITQEDLEKIGGGGEPVFGYNVNVLDGGGNLNDKSLERKERYDYFREMDTMEFIHRALEIVADDSTQNNNEGNVLKLYSDDDDIKNILDDLFFERLDLNNELWSIVYETCKMGDNFYEIVVDDYTKPKKIVQLRFLEPEKVSRVEVNGKLAYFQYTIEKLSSINRSVKEEETIYKLQPWQIIHFKLENKEFLPYGGSLLNSGIKTYKKLNLLEDIMLIYRISRAPERRVFYIDVGNLNNVESRRFLEKVKNMYRSQAFIDENGRINKKAHVMSVTSDIFVPVREGSQGTRIETLQGGEALHNIDDMKYFRDKILRTMNIPPAYLGDETDRSRGSLCLHPDTKIKLADGRNISIKKIAEEFETGKTNYVYSVNEKTLEWEINKIKWAGVTRKNAEVVKVKLDNDEEVICTPEHLFMLRDGTYREAKDLTLGTSLMPVYTKLSSVKNKDKIDGYEMLLSNKTGKWEYTHRIAKKEELNETNNDVVIHHSTFDKLNNNPDSLEILDKKKHLKLHQELIVEVSKNFEIVAKRNKSIRKFYATEEGLEIIRANQKKASGSENHLTWLHSEEHKNLKREQMKKQQKNGTLLNTTEEAKQKISDSAKRRWQDPAYREQMKIVCSNGGKANKGNKHGGYKSISVEDIKNNYKENSTIKEIALKLNINRHTLTKKIKELGYKNLEELIKQPLNHKVVSVEYLVEKVDTYDITVDRTPNFSTLCLVLHNSQLDIKFSRFIERVQTQVLKGLNKIAALELFFNRKKKEDLGNFQLELTAPSNIKEITEIDVYNQKISLLGNIQQLQIFSNQWMLKNILKLSDKEIADILLYKNLEGAQQQAGAGGAGGGAMPGGMPGANPEMPPAEPGAENGVPPTPGTLPGTVPGAEAGATGAEGENLPTEITASALVNVLGKDFLVENRKDFIKLMRIIKEEKRKGNDKIIDDKKLFEDVAKIFLEPEKDVDSVNTNNITSQIIGGELGGLIFENNGTRKRAVKLYEKKNINKERTVYLKD